MNKLFRTVLWLTVFSIAMGFMESAVVIYLRQLYYPEGFHFPFVPIPMLISIVEFLREAATIIMLLAIGIIAGRNTVERFSFFLFCFAVWDLFYYVFLKVFLDWPESFFTWDILFLIPVPWIGPVLAPCIDSVTMIVLTMAVAYFHQKDYRVTLNRLEWFLLIVGSVIQIVGYTFYHLKYFSFGDASVWTDGSRKKMLLEIANYIPYSFPWGIFLIGEIFIITSVILMIKRHRNQHSASKI
jgi:hypothetical protein